MRFSEERIRHLSHEIVNAIYFDDLVDYEDEEAVTNEVKKVLFEYVEQEDNIDNFVRSKISSLKRDVPIGSSEWDILYKKYYEEEMRKKNIF